MKTSGSPCPLDQISVICFKRCPYLRTVITEIIGVVWKSGRVPSAWKRACTVLVHKKGNHDDPANFRPITLQSVPLKIFTSCLHDTIFSFLKQNGFIEQQIQKGFTNGVSGHARKSCLMSICKLGGSRVPPSHTVKISQISQTSKNFPFSTRIKKI